MDLADVLRPVGRHAAPHVHKAGVVTCVDDGDDGDDDGGEEHGDEDGDDDGEEDEEEEDGEDV